MKHGALGFNPGDWWINGIFAFHAGVIDLNCTGGGICADKKGAYAVVMKGADEIYTESPDKFRYRCKSNDPGRFRMTSADFRSRYPIRVLRSHTLNSLWSPRSGIRYEGLLTVPQNLRKSLSPINADVRGKSVSRKPDNPSSCPTTADKDRSKSAKDTSFANNGKEAKSSLAKSFTRIFSDGALDIADIPESPFGSTFDDDDTNHNEFTSYPFDMTPLPSHPIDTFSHPILRQIKWGSAPRDLAANPPTPKSVSRRRRDRAVYEAFSRQGRPPDPRLLLAAIDDIADDVAEPEYPDMVLEEPTVRESHSGYAGFRAGSGESGRETRAADQRSDDYMRRIPPGGIDLARFTAQQEAACGGGAGRKDGRFDDGDEAGGHVGRMLRELSAASSPGGGAAAAADAGMAERRRHSGRLASVGGEKGARRSSLSAFDTRMPGPSAVMEDGVARFAPAKGGVRRPTIVRFSGMFKRQSLEETVDEVFDEGAAAEEEEKKKNRKKKEKENDGGSGSVEQLLEKSFASTPNW
ncbi:hypothetical protein UCRNP2_7789 [Neofusicoccum parvum UCRNP2]|uniref:Uncharacterized protein n=1 Tax=Botryosphaeria parva (strain UCR-NP2) TaxID=1287680 RepID=R1GHT3_BOTPV|nr:hypothetical protein UCRNP2_7789 [Neofusicoccum parvum UCRNP2]